jgi:enoyl-CoA hydratase/carnithine racemase
VSAPLSLREARARVCAPDASETLAPLGDAPLLAVALDGEADDDAEAARALASMPAPLVALVRDPAAPAARVWAPRFDALAADADALARIETGIRAAPLAAATLAQLLRTAATRGIEAGLVAESLAYASLQAGPEHRAWLAARGARAPSHADSSPICVDRDGARLHLTLTRPARRNAWSAALRDAFVEALALAAQDSTIERILVDGEGPDFCSGGDIDEFGTTPDPATAHAIRMMRSPARWMARLAARTEVQLHGACIGAGIELAAFAQRVIARRDAWFQLPELAMGLVPGAGGTVSLPRRIGRQRTAWLAFTGARIDAETALRWHLVDALADAPPCGARERRRRRCSNSTRTRTPSRKTPIRRIAACVTKPPSTGASGDRSSRSRVSATSSTPRSTRPPTALREARSSTTAIRP